MFINSSLSTLIITNTTSSLFYFHFPYFHFLVVPWKFDMATSSRTPLGSKNLPTIDLRDHRSNVSKSIVEACDQFGFFKVINHGVPKDIIEKVQQEGFSFFAKPTFVKQQAAQASPTNPLGYGHKNIGALGDKGELEYLLLSTHPSYIAEKSITISDDPLQFRYLICYDLL